MPVEWTIAAKSDLRAIGHYIADSNEAAAFLLLDKIQERASRLCQFPEQGRIVPELYNAGITSCREVMVSHWRIIYQIERDRVLVSAVFDGRRNLQEVLFERFRFLNV